MHMPTVRLSILMALAAPPAAAQEAALVAVRPRTMGTAVGP